MCIGLVTLDFLVGAFGPDFIVLCSNRIVCVIEVVVEFRGRRSSFTVNMDFHVELLSVRVLWNFFLKF